MACDASAYPLIFGKDSDNIPNRFVEADAIGLGTVSANLFVSAGTDIASLFDTLITEDVQDVVGGMLGGTETGISVTYNDDDNDIDFVVADTTVAGDSGSTGMTPGDTLTIAGGTNVTTAMSGDTLTITSTDTNTQLTQEQVEDYAGNVTVSGGTKTGIALNYSDTHGTMDFVVADTTVAGDSGSTGMTPGDTLTIAGGTGCTTAMSGDTLTVTVDAVAAETTYGDGVTLNFGTGTDSKISFDGTDTLWNPRAAGTGNLIVSGGSLVGIGQTSPKADLHVSGSQRVVGVFENNTASAVLSVVGTSTSSIITASSTDTTITNTAAGNIYFMTNEAYVMTLENGGKVGVGTTDPGQAIDVVGTTADTQVSIRVDNQDGGAASDARLILKVASTGGDAYVRMFEQSGNSWCMGAYTQGSPGTTFRITDHTNLDSNVAIEIDASQDIWMPKSLAVGQSAKAADYVVLECDSTTEAFLPPRMTTTQRDAVGGGIANPATGSVIYNTSTNVLNFFNGSSWGAV